MAWEEQDNKTRGTILPLPITMSELSRILESRKLETPAIIIDAIEPSDKA